MRKGSKKRKLPPFRRMEAIEYRRGMSAMGWLEADVAARFGVGKRTVRRHKNGEARIDGPTTIVMRLIVEGVVSPEEAERAAAGLYPIRRGTRGGRARGRAVDAAADSAHNSRP
jgi:hypothetical protein